MSIWRPLAAALLGGALSVGVAAGQADDFVLVRNAKNMVSSLSRAEVKDMAVGKKKVWPHGQVVQMVLGRPGSPELAWFTSFVVGAPESTFMARVRQEVFKGEMRRPIVVPSEKDCLAAVVADPGALGAISAATAKHLPDEVAVVTLR